MTCLLAASACGIAAEAQTTNDTKISGPAQSDAYFFLPAFSTDDYTSSAVYEAVKTMMDEVLVNFKDPAAAIEACLNSLK